MAETSLFWDGTATGDASIAPYDAGTEFSKVMASMTGADQNANYGGVWPGALNSLAVSSPSANTARVASGRAQVYGAWYENTANVDTNIPTPSVSTRIDRMVLRKSWSAQTVRITRIAGTEGAGAPALTQSAGTTWDIPLAQVSITTGGAITVTDQRENLVGSKGKPAFSAYVSATVATQTGNGATVTVPFDTEVKDQDNNFNNSTYTFTAPSTGTYAFQTQVTLNAMTTAMSSCDLKIVTTARTYRCNKSLNVKTAGDAIVQEMRVLADMSAGDTAIVTVSVAGGASNAAGIVGNNNLETRFAGWQVS